MDEANATKGLTYRLRELVKKGNKYYSIGIPREIVKHHDLSDRFTVHRTHDGFCFQRVETEWEQAATQ